MFDLGKLLHTSNNLQKGAVFRDYIIVPDGNYFIKPTDRDAIRIMPVIFFCAGVKRLLHEKLVCLKFLVKSSIDEFVAAVNKDVNTQGLSISAGSIILLLHIHYNVIKSMTGGVTGIGFAYF